MTSGIPNVNHSQPVDIDVQVWLGFPDTPARESYNRNLYDAHDITISYGDGGDHNALEFSIYKDSNNGQDVQDLAGDVELIVRWWDPRRRALLEPPGSRFVILSTDEDMVDGTNVVTYSCIATTWLLEQVKVRTTDYVNYAAKLNRDYDRAEERYQEAEREYDSALRSFESQARRVQERLWPNLSKGPNFVGRGVAWYIRDRKARYRSIVYNGNTNRLSWYSRDRGGFVLLNMNPSDSNPVSRRERLDLRNAGRDTLRARSRMNTARRNFAAAERAARETSRDGTRFFYNRTPARVLTDLWIEGVERDSGFVGHNDGTGTWDSPYEYRPRYLKGIYRHFTGLRDAKNRDWPRSTRGNWEVRLGQSWWDTLQDFRERGMMDLRMGGTAVGGGGRSLQLVPQGHLEVDQSRRVAFRLDVNVTEAPETVDRSRHQSVTLILDSTGLNRYVHGTGIDSSPRPGDVSYREWESSQTPWGLFEGSMSEPDADTLRQGIELTNEERRKLADRYQIDASRKALVTHGQPIPMLDYEPHHLVTVYDHDEAASVRKVSQVIVEKSGGNEPIEVTVRFGTRFTSREVSYGRTLNKILGGSEHIQGHIPLHPSLTAPDIPREALYAPAITSLGARIKFNEEGRARAMLSATISTHDLPEPADAEVFDSTPEGREYLIDEEYEGA